MELADTKLAVLDTSVFKVVIYRDELESAWDLFIKHPVRHLTELLPALQLCRGRKCGTDCPKFHPPLDEEIDGAIKKFGPENSFPSPERLRILRMHASTSSISEWQLLLQIRSLNLR